MTTKVWKYVPPTYKRANYAVFYYAVPAGESPFAYALHVSRLLTREAALTMFNVFPDAFMVVKVRGWFKRAIRIRLELAI